MLVLDQIHLSTTGQTCVALSDLGGSHGLSGGQARMYERFFGLSSVACHRDDLGAMLAPVLRAAFAGVPVDRRASGQLFYCKTQTHNTLSDGDWLRRLADAEGLAGWDVSAVTMTSCASALALMHFAQLADTETPLIVLTGEKAFHPSISRLPVGLLAEVPAAALFNAGAAGSWRVRGTTVRHLPRFYKNADAMSAEERAALQACYADQLGGFVADSLEQYGPALHEDFVFLPHNLNLPVTQVLLRRFEWHSRCFQGDIGTLGHAFCADIFVNLRAFEASDDPRDRAARQILVLAAGTGVTFATCLLERTPNPPSKEK
ncbi:MAG: hypothetical protein AB7U46_09450 [Paenirhodobacter sp.]|uniref:3-oxoacyl-[acyl-carrier-protein] synthase III C-terminal domain-containing protein n=1 Tax=Paenirhodobacter sp. TaxID=1965326 RepID=UPI003D138E14